MHGGGRLRRISSDSESASVYPGEEEWATSPTAPAVMLVNISFVLILMEFQCCINVILETSPAILGENNNVMGNTGMQRTVCQCYK